jgi:hypothetical protein
VTSRHQGKDANDEENLMASDEHDTGGRAVSGPLYLGALHFDGDPGELLPAYRRLLERFGIDTLDVHLCISRENGLTVFDACPAKAIYEEFTGSDTFREAVDAAGLPAPRIEGLGDVRVAHLRREVRP